MNMSELEYRKPLQWGEIDPYRRGRTHVVMWAWLLQRVSAVFIVFLVDSQQNVQNGGGFGVVDSQLVALERPFAAFDRIVAEYAYVANNF